MNFYELRKTIKTLSNSNEFSSASSLLEEVISSVSRQELISILFDIGILPEDIDHDSSEEKLYTKTADIVLSKSLCELGLESSIYKERSNCADVVATSHVYNYSLVADAKAFRLSRSAKNQKDFKVKSLSDWRGDKDFSVLVCPYYQYPKSNSQIYGQALKHNVALLSWEHLAFLLENAIEDKHNLSWLWNISDYLFKSGVNGNNSFLELQNEKICSMVQLSMDTMRTSFKGYRGHACIRGNTEKYFFQDKKNQIKNMSKQRLGKELLRAWKIEERESCVDKLILQLKKAV